MTAFYQDTDVPAALARLIRIGTPHAVTTGRSLGLRFADDDHHLLEATRLGLVLITHNAKDFWLLHRAWHRWTLAWGVTLEHAPILALAQRPAPELLAALEQLDAEGLPQGNEIATWSPARGWQRQP